MWHPVCSHTHFTRRSLLWAGAAGFWLTPLSQRLARAAEADAKKQGGRAKSVILLWLEGGPSQYETFDPHAGTKYGGEVKAIPTSVKGVEFAENLPRTAEHMHRIGLLRAVTSKEGDHARAIYNIKTGYRPDPTLIHPSIGAIACHEIQEGADIPRHISILPGGHPGRGGYLGAKYDAFKVYDPAGPIQDVRRGVSDERFTTRVGKLENVLETEFAKDRLLQLDQTKTMHLGATRAALTMMDSEQLTAFDVSKEPESERLAFGDTAFGRGCLAAARLIEVGVRCVEVALGGWDTHVNNHVLQGDACKTLDPALAALLKRLSDRDLLDSTLVVCGGEFGRHPVIDPSGGRGHWPHGFSIAMAGCGIRGGVVHGATSESPNVDSPSHEKDLKDPVTVGDVHATMLKALGIQWDEEQLTPVGRPMKFSEGTPIPQLLT